MRFLEAVGEGFKAAGMMFSGRKAHWWGTFLNRATWDLRREVGDGTSNSIIVATLGWISRNFPEAPFRIRERDEDGEWSETQDPGAIRLVDLLRSPNPYFSGVLLWMATIVDYWVNGNAVWWKIRQEGGPGSGAVRELWWIPWALIEPRWPEDGSVYISHYEYKPDPTKTIKIEPTEVVHFRYGLDPDNIRVGRSPLLSILREIFTDDQAAAFSASLLRNLGVPGVVISPVSEDQDMDSDGAKGIKADFSERFGGDNRGAPLVMSQPTNISVLSFNPQQMDLKGLRRVPEERVTAVTGVPAIVAGLGAGLDRSTFANFAEAREAGFEENILPSQRNLASQIDIQLLPDFVVDRSRFLCDFDPTGIRVLQEDQTALWTRAADAASKGLITIASFKQQIGLPVNDEADHVYLRAFNVVTVPEDQTPEESMIQEQAASGPDMGQEPPAGSSNGTVTDGVAQELITA